METTKTITDQGKDFFNSIVPAAKEGDSSIILIISDGKETTAGMCGSGGRLAMSLYNASFDDPEFRHVLEATMAALELNDRHGDDDDEEADNNFDDYDDYDEGVDQDLPDCPALPADEA